MGWQRCLGLALPSKSCAVYGRPVEELPRAPLQDLQARTADSSGGLFNLQRSEVQQAAGSHCAFPGE